MRQTMTDTAIRPAPGTRLRGYSSGLILVTGVMLVPLAIGFLFNSWDAPDAAAYVRMAFAQVAGATIAIGTVAGLLLQRIIRRTSAGQIACFAFIAVAVTTTQLFTISNGVTTLLARLGL